MSSLQAMAADISITPDSSLQDAVRKAREMRRLGKANDVTLHLSAGTYYLYDPLRLRPEDSGLRIEGDGAVITGGMPITGWKRQGKWLVASVPDFNGRPVDFRQLYINGEKAVRARDVSDFEQMHRIMTYDKKNHVLWIPKAAATPLLRGGVKGGGEYAELVLHEMWCSTNLRIKSMTVQGDSVAVRFHNPEAKLQFEHPWPSPMTPDTKHPSPFYLTNALELLDEPGEWYHDIREHKVYYMPRKGETIREAIVPVLPTLVEFIGTPERPVRNITIKGVAFHHTTWMRPSEQGHVPLQAGMFLTEAYKLRPQIDRPNNHKLDNQGWLGRADAAVELRWTEGCHFESCRFEHLGGSGLDYVVGCKGGTTTRCTFTDIAMNGYVCGSFSPEGLETHLPYQPTDFREVCTQQEVANCHFYNVTNEDWGCVAIAAGYVNGITIDSVGDGTATLYACATTASMPTLSIITRSTCTTAPASILSVTSPVPSSARMSSATSLNRHMSTTPTTGSIFILTRALRTLLSVTTGRLRKNSSRMPLVLATCGKTTGQT